VIKAWGKTEAQIKTTPVFPRIFTGLSPETIMAKFRSHYAGSGGKRGRGKSFLFRTVLYGMVLLYLLYALARFIQKADWKLPGQAEDRVESMGALDSLDFFPAVSTGNQLVIHRHFALSYSEKHEQAEWVAYELTVDELNSARQERFDYFSPDHKITTRSAVHRDYSGSGYTRGHLAPAADMAHDPVAAEECFFMSNISPQEKAFNNGIWRELEEQVRDWARKNRRLYVVTGPILNQGIRGKIGKNRVSVPSLFYKVLLDYTPPDFKGIAFLLPNESSERKLQEYAYPIDSVEALTGINFFTKLESPGEMESLENSINLQAWPFSQERFKERVQVWNKQE